MYDIPSDRSFLQLLNGIRHVMPSTDRKLELTAKASMAQPVSQPAVCCNGLMKASMKKKALFRWYRAVHVRVREELQDVFVFPIRECGEHCMQRTCIHTTSNECKSRNWRFCSEAGILQVTQWQSPVASLHSV